MATTHLTEEEAQELGIPDLIRRVQSGEEIRIEGDGGPIVLAEATEPLFDNSIRATLHRFRQMERETGEPLRMGEDFADDVEKIVAMRRPGRGDPWA
jgi:antitoxin (DNA-binding transcriptional repressor) of toxin-antitoxin stability system